MSLELHRCLYHEYPFTNTPDMVFLLNAGLWGYDSWEPALTMLGRRLPGVPVVVTAYTFEESEDDFDAVERGCSGGDSAGTVGLRVRVRVRWAAESRVNPALHAFYLAQLPQGAATDAALAADSEAYRAYRGRLSAGRAAALCHSRSVGGRAVQYLPNYFLQCFSIELEPVLKPV